MYIIITADCPAYGQILNIHAAMQAARLKAREAVCALLSEVGKASEDFYVPSNKIGGVLGIVFDKAPMGWVNVPKLGRNVFIPKRNSDLYRRHLKGLPVVSRAALDDLIGFEYFQNNRFYRPGWKFSESRIGVEIHQDCDYKLMPGMVEVTKSEYIAAFKPQEDTAKAA